jgi:hypothetical protein
MFYNGNTNKVCRAEVAVRVERFERGKLCLGVRRTAQHVKENGMLALGVLLLIVWLVCQIFAVAAGALALILKVSLALIIVGAILDFLTGFRAYTWIRRR